MTAGAGSPPRQRVGVITGATSGIGRATALALGRAGVHVALLGRNVASAKSILERLGRQAPNAGRAFRVDLADLDDVRRVASQVRAYGAIDILVNNAGARFTDFGTTRDGVERTFATNHLGHFLLTCLLIEQLMAAPAARVITIGSSAHAMSVADWLPGRDRYDRKTAYAVSKLANIMFAYELARRLRETAVSSNAFDPGGVATNLGRNNGTVPWLRHLLYYAVKRQLRRPDSAARDLARLSLGDEFRGITGKYFSEHGESTSGAISHDPSSRRDLWRLSVQLTGLDSRIGAAWRYVDPAVDAM